MNDEYESSVDAAENIRSHIEDVESVADALFDEWTDELGQYTSQNLRRDSERQMQETRRRYNRVIGAMRRAEQTLDPVLNKLRDNTLFLKHNLNARAIASLKGELGTINIEVNRLVEAMEQAIAESNQFIEELKQQ